MSLALIIHEPAEKPAKVSEKVESKNNETRPSAFSPEQSPQTPSPRKAALQEKAIVVDPAQLHEKPFKFPFGAIPYGDTMENVLSRVEGADIKEDEYVMLESIGAYRGLRDYFRGGLYQAWGTSDPNRFNSKLAKKYTVKYAQWEEIKAIDLYFVSDFNSRGSYTLFCVRKELEAADGNYQTVFAGIKNRIEGTLGISPETYSTEYQDLFMKADRTYEPALMAIWTLKEQKLFLLVRNQGGFPGRPEIIYVSNQGWQKYIRSVKSYEGKKMEEQGKTAIRNF